MGCCQLQPENDEDEDKEEEDALVSCEMLSEVVYVEGFEEKWTVVIVRTRNTSFHTGNEWVVCIFFHHVFNQIKGRLKILRRRGFVQD